MTTLWGWWTRYVNIAWDYSFDDAKKCWLSNRNWTNSSKTIECFNPNRLNFEVSEVMIKEDADWNGTIDSSGEVWKKTLSDTYPSQIEKLHSWSRKCRWWKEYMTVMSSASSGYPNSSLSNVSRVRFWLSFCNPGILLIMKCDEGQQEVLWIIQALEIDQLLEIGNLMLNQLNYL